MNIKVGFDNKIYFFLINIEGISLFSVNLKGLDFVKISLK